ncbi:MAG TPA: mechanosensitive ion channel domain-containing protein, partial [Terriglobia bacterium]|nr:mechanosensitive ion channel domain-containing protein [Terriglobia bacterium]
FVLMGRNGIHVGDWVEINGVRGEVMEIGLLRTLLLETGNWTEAGHPTGRQVAFLNSYAVEGYFFNFSTAGQWMWDDLSLIIPKNEDPYPLIEQIRALVTKETEPSLREAEAEWRRAAHRSGFELFSAGTEINMTPGDSGTKLIVRYMTKAAERYEVRSRLSRALVKLLHHGEKLLPMTPNSDTSETKTSLPADPGGRNGNRPAPAEEKLAKAGDKV